MKYIKWFDIFESNNHLFDEAREIIEDYKSEVTDLGLDLVINPVDVGYIDENLIDVEYLLFKISTRDDEAFEILSECYDVLYDLRSHLSRECDLDLKVYIHSDFPLFDLDDAVEVYGGEEWDVLEFYVYKKK
jgi:hypothetical protein